MRLLLFVLFLCLPGFALANVRIDVGCSGALFKMEGMTLDQKALILTAGHCSDLGSFKGPEGSSHADQTFPGAGEVLIDQRRVGHVDIRDAAGKFHRHQFSRIILATMTGVDVAVIELDETYRAILGGQKNIEIYDLSPTAPWPGTPVRVEAARWNVDFACQIENLVPVLKEDPWTWTNAIRFRFSPDCTFYGGVSGSPVLDQHNRIVGVANSGSDTGTPCGFESPCEIYGRGAPMVAPVGQSYGTPTDGLNDCYSPARRTFDFKLPMCRLAPPDHSPDAVVATGARSKVLAFGTSPITQVGRVLGFAVNRSVAVFSGALHHAARRESHIAGV